MSDRATEQLQQWIAAERERPAPPDAHADTVWSKVQGRLEGTTAAPPWAPPAGRPLWPWLVAGVGVLITAGALLATVERPSPTSFDSTNALALSAPVHGRSAPRLGQLHLAPPVETSAPTTKPPRPIDPPTRFARELSASTTSGGTFAEELAFIERGRTALAGKQYGRVLAAMREHRKAFPHGALREEAAALRTAATCGKDEVTHSAAARESFTSKWPRSVHADLVRRHCRSMRGY